MTEDLALVLALFLYNKVVKTETTAVALPINGIPSAFLTYREIGV